MSQHQYRNAPCNPLIITNRADPEDRYCVTCRVCGHHYDQWTTRYQVAQQLQQTHERATTKEWK